MHNMSENYEEIETYYFLFNLSSLIFIFYKSMYIPFFILYEVIKYYDIIYWNCKIICKG